MGMLSGIASPQVPGAGPGGAGRAPFTGKRQAPPHKRVVKEGLLEYKEGTYVGG